MYMYMDVWMYLCDIVVTYYTVFKKCGVKLFAMTSSTVNRC